jgi:hypothetical protein
MFLLSQFGKLQLGKIACGTSLFAIVLAILVAAGCSRPVQGAPNAHSDRPPVPFHEGSPAAADSNQAVEANPQEPDAGLPLRDSAGLPVGTLLTVKLNNPISADSPDTSGTFNAIVDEPVQVNGVTIVPRGASASGRVESARASSLKRNRSYVRLSLETISVSGRDLPVQTSSLFARGSADHTPDSAVGQSVNSVHLDKGRRLTFRLTSPVSIASEKVISSR